jgi:hypothetical protein
MAEAGLETMLPGGPPVGQGDAEVPLPLPPAAASCCARLAICGVAAATANAASTTECP